MLVDSRSAPVALQRTLYSSDNPMRRWLHLTRRDRILAAIARAPVRQRNRAMEVGPGSGIYLPALCDAFASVTALDVEDKHLREIEPMAVELGNLELVRADLTAFDCGEPFDLVLCSEVIEHVRDPAPFVAGLTRAVAPGGILVFSTPQPLSIMELTCKIGLSPGLIGFTRWIYGEPVLPTGHVSVLSKRRVKALLDENDFETLSSETFGLYLPLLAEFGGRGSVAVARPLEVVVRRMGLGWLLWTQLHIARRR